MTTTAVFAEILVVGLQATVWLALLCLWIADVNGIPVGRVAAKAGALKEWATLITTFVLGFAYTLGIIVDRLADSIQSSIEKALSTKREPDKSVPPRRLRVMKDSPEITKLLEYFRTRMRIARSTSLNLLLTTLAAVLIARHAGCYWILMIVGTGLALVVVATFVSRRIAKTYDERLGEAYDLVTSAKTS